MYILKRWYRYVPNPPYLITWVSGKGFLVPGNGKGKLKITFPFYGKGTGIRKLLREGKFEGIPGII